MEVKINREIRGYTEAMFFGLSMRQFFFSALGCVMAVAVYFLLRDKVGLELLTWLCVFAVVPCAALGFLKYNGMPAEKFIKVFFISSVLTPKRLVCKSFNLYEEVLKESRNEKRKERRHDKKHKPTV